MKRDWNGKYVNKYQWIMIAYDSSYSALVD